MDDPPAQSSRQSANEGPENLMLIDKEWRPADGRDIPELMTSVVFDLGTPVSEEEEPTGHSSHFDAAAEDCEFKVEFETGQYLQHDNSTGWAIEDAS